MQAGTPNLAQKKADRSLLWIISQAYFSSSSFIAAMLKPPST